MKQHYLTPQLFYIVLAIIITSCSTAKDYKDYNFYNGGQIFNDTLNFKMQLIGGMMPNQEIKKKETKKLKRDLPPLKDAHFLDYSKRVIPNFYDTYLFYKPNDLPQSSTDTSALVLKDTINRYVLYRTNRGNKSLYLLIKGPNESEFYAQEDTLNRKKGVIVRFDPTMRTEVVSGKEMIQSIKFDYTEEDLPTYWDIFDTYRNFENVLFVKNKIETMPIQKTEQDRWNKKQIILTLLSMVSDSKEYVNEVHNRNKINYLQRFIDQALQQEKGVILSSTNVLKEIEKLAEKEQIVMLNESHWKPEHRIAAARLLKPLKDAGYKYLAVEAVAEDRDIFINKHNIPLFTSGYYTSEPYFGLFIRAAKKLGFTIVSYDYYDSLGTKGREMTEAENILKILDDDPQAKIFVYAGLAHINEKTASTKRMAEYLKEMSGIDPITINQELLEGVTHEDMILFDTQSFPEDERINKTVDYFLLNNIQPSLKEFFPETPFIDYSIKIPPLKKYKNQDVFVSVFLSEEYDKYKRNAVSIKNIIYQVNDNYIRLNLPVGTYQLKIQDVENKLVYDKKIEISIN